MHVCESVCEWVHVCVCVCSFSKFTLLALQWIACKRHSATHERAKSAINSWYSTRGISHCLLPPAVCATPTYTHTHIHSVRGMSLAFIQFMICIRSLSVAFRNYNTQSIWKYAALDDHNVAYYADDPAPTPTPTVPQPASTSTPTVPHSLPLVPTRITQQAVNQQAGPVTPPPCWS